jgi:hypothetical protein
LRVLGEDESEMLHMIARGALPGERIGPLPCPQEDSAPFARQNGSVPRHDGQKSTFRPQIKFQLSRAIESNSLSKEFGDPVIHVRVNISPTFTMSIQK